MKITIGLGLQLGYRWSTTISADGFIVMHLQKMASLHNRRMDQAAIGTTIENPNIDFAKLAQSMGVWAEGPIADPNAIAPALSRALAAVKRGEPALVDIISQGR